MLIILLSIFLLVCIGFYLYCKTRTSPAYTYLASVYPTANLKHIEASQLDNLYNHLWFYYNCESQFSGSVLGTDICWQELPECGTTYPKMPYVPAGYFYSFTDWIQHWIPFKEYKKGEIEPKNLLASVPAQTFWHAYNGPAPVWMFQRSVFRYIYNENSPVKDSKNGRTYPQLLAGPIDNLQQKPSWNYPQNWWLGVPDHGYIEVTGASEPGIPTSPPLIWYDGWIGSGMFLNVGKSLRVRNKVDATWQLAKQMVDEGHTDLLKRWFYSDDPNQISLNLVTADQNQNCKTGPITLLDINGKKTQFNICIAGYYNNGSIPNTNKGWNDIEVFYVPDTKAWCTSTNMEDCVNQMRFGLNYKADRQSSIMTFDEPMFLMGSFLNYDTIQMTLSANGAGFWQYEILELRGYPDEVKMRDYSAFLKLETNYKLSFNADFVRQYMETITQHLSLRDPFDVYNDAKATHCVSLPWNASLTPMDYIYRNKDAWEYNITCKDNLSDMFAKLSIYGGPNNQCSPTGIGRGNQPMKTAKDWPYG